VDEWSSGYDIAFTKPFFLMKESLGKESFSLREKKPSANLRDALASLTVSEPYRFRKSLGKKLRKTKAFFS